MSTTNVITVLTEQELRDCVQLDADSLAAVADGFTKLAEGKATVPPIMMIPVPERHGEVDVKSAYVAGIDSFAVKIASGFYDNPTLGLPSGSGLMVVVSAQTGFPQAILLDNGYLTELRTAVAGAIAAQYLAPDSIGTVGVIGAGVQGRFQVRALRLVRDFQRVLVYDGSPDAVARYETDMTAELGLEVRGVPSAASVVTGSDIVITCTPSRRPLVMAEWLREGHHITAMGCDSEEKQELDPAIFARADRIACDRKSQCFRLGELHHAAAVGVIGEDHDIAELGELTAGTRQGRANDREITVCDLTGVGVQDTAIALLAYERARERGLGIAVGG